LEFQSGWVDYPSSLQTGLNLVFVAEVGDGDLGIARQADAILSEDAGALGSIGREELELLLS